MSEQQIVISLKKMSLSLNQPIAKVILSVSSTIEEVFCSSWKNNKNNKINFYREKLTVRHLAGPISFNILGLAAGTYKKCLLGTLEMGIEQMTRISKAQTAYQIIKNGFELTFDAWSFSEVSSAIINATLRDYEELDLQFLNMNTSSQLGNILNVNGIKNRLDEYKSYRKLKQLTTVTRKRANSSDDLDTTKSHESINKGSSLRISEKEISLPKKLNISLNLTHQKGKIKNQSQKKLIIKKGGRVKHRLCSKMVSTFASLFAK